MALASQGLKFNSVYIQSPQTGGKPIDLTGHLEYIEYFENILSPTISMKMQLRSSYNFVSELPIRGGEMISMDIDTLFGNFKFGKSTKESGITPGSGELYVYGMKNLDQPSMAQSFSLHVTSPEYFSNETTRCMKKYKSATIDKHVTDVLENTMNIKSNRIGTIDETTNTYSFMGNTKKPFHTIEWLCPKAIASSKHGVSGEGEYAKAVGTAGYFFYETRDGFQFRSIEGLVSNTRSSIGFADVKKQGVEIHGPYTYQGHGAFGNAYDLDENFKINFFHIDRGSDIRKSLAIGQFANKTLFFDSLTQKVSQYDYQLEEHVENRLGNVKEADGSKIPVPNNVKNLTSRLFVRISDHGALGIGTGGLGTSGRDEADMAKSFSRYNALFSQSVNIQIPLNIKIKAGDLINCVFPELKDGQSSELDAKASGNYLVVRLNHHIQGNASFTSLNLVRDSYGYSKVKVEKTKTIPAYKSHRDKQKRLRESQFD